MILKNLARWTPAEVDAAAGWTKRQSAAFVRGVGGRMSQIIDQAKDLLNDLHTETLDYADYCLLMDALDAGETYERNEEVLQEKNAQLQRERDAAVADIKLGVRCDTCKHQDTDRCGHAKCQLQGYDYWAWRGPQEVEHE